MPIIRYEGEHAVHAEFKAPGFISMVTTREGKDGKTYSHHVIQDEFTTAITDFMPQNGDFQVKSNSDGSFFSYASADPNAVHEYLKRHRRAFETWAELHGIGAHGLDDAMRYAAGNKHQEPVRHYNKEENK